MAGHPGAQHEHGQHAHEDGPSHDEHGFAEVAQAVGHDARRRRLRRGFLAAVFTVALLCLAAEVGLRLSGQRLRALEGNITQTNRRWVELTRAGLFEEIADPVRHYAMRPGAECAVDGWRFRVSSQRSRGPDFPRAKPAGEKRLLCLGDSFAFGLWCDEEDTLVAHLAARAEERERELGRDTRWRAIDLGVPGYHSGQTLRAFEQEGLALAPDAVVLYFNTNDIEQSGFYYDAELGSLRRDYLPLPSALKTTLWHWSHLYGWISTRFVRMAESGPAPYLDARVPFAHVRADNQAYARAAVARIAELCRERALPLFLVDQPLIDYLGSTRRADWAVLPLIEWAEGMRTELGIPGLSLLGWLRGYADGVDRLAEGAPPDFLPDLYVADEGVQAAVRWAAGEAAASARDWSALSFHEQTAILARYPGTLPSTPDFHLTGAAYAHIARLVYPLMQEQGMLP